MSSTAVERLNAALSGRYRIERELGEGGMATVYLAADLKHERKVALKVLKPELAAVVGADRFLAEIKTTANLQHPHILPLFDSGEADSFLFYVMPYVEGESLREKLDREHQLPVDEAVRVATDVAEALDYAHRKGVVHRDIKPGNVLLHDGQVVISDFGIALALDSATPGRLTDTGLSLGTPHYMSPEQASGDQNVGRTTDIYALACVLYEMLIGEPPFTGSTPQAILGKIIAGETPSITAQRGSVPPHVDATIRKALEKVPADRVQSMSDFALALAAQASVPTREPRMLVSRFRLGVAVIGLIAVAVALTRGFWGAPAGPSSLLESRDWRQITYSGGVRSGAISPDGDRLAYVDDVDTFSGDVPGRRLMVLDLETGDELELARYGHGLSDPKWHPSGTRIAFASGGLIGHVHGIYTISSLGQDARFIFPEGDAFDWSPDGERLVAVDSDVLYDIGVSDRGITVDTVPLEPIPPPQGVVWSPGDERISVTTADSELGIARLYLMALDGSVTDTLEDVTGSAAWTADGRWLLFEGEEGLAVIEVDEDGHFAGDRRPVPLPYQEVRDWAYHDRSGLLAVNRGPEEAHVYQVPMGDADADAVQLTRGTAGYYNPSISQDGRLLAYVRWTPTQGGDLHYRVVDGGSEQRLTRSGEIGSVGSWSPDGARLTYTIPGDSGYVVMTVGLAGAPPRRAGGSLASGPNMARPLEYGAEGRTVVYALPDGENLVQVDLESGAETVLLPEREDPRDMRGRPVLSPDGRRLAYLSDLVVGPRQLWTLDLEQGVPEKLADGNVEPLVWLNSDTLIVARGAWATPATDVREVSAISVSDGGSRRLGTFPEGCMFLSITRDGRMLYCGQGEGSRDFWLGSVIPDGGGGE